MSARPTSPRTRGARVTFAGSWSSRRRAEGLREVLVLSPGDAAGDAALPGPDHTPERVVPRDRARSAGRSPMSLERDDDG
ncbi:MAG: hypothetical protein H0V18_11700 [Pyrinomonadaceae bacterium]|nr:hypothetical protein [Pyrinomonadaceae bacterium]